MRKFHFHATMWKRVRRKQNSSSIFSQICWICLHLTLRLRKLQSAVRLINVVECSGICALAHCVTWYFFQWNMCYNQTEIHILQWMLELESFFIRNINKIWRIHDLLINWYRPCDLSYLNQVHEKTSII